MRNSPWTWPQPPSGRSSTFRQPSKAFLPEWDREGLDILGPAHCGAQFMKPGRSRADMAERNLEAGISCYVVSKPIARLVLF